MLFLTTFFALFSLFTSQAQAQTKIGTHLGVGDPSHQISIMNSIGSINGKEQDFPVTIMVDSGFDRQTIESLAQAAKDNNFFPIVRINYVCENSRDPVGTARMAYLVFDQIMGGNFILTFGNEVNNKTSNQVGCTDWTSYANNYRSVRLALPSKVSPSALDWYMGVPEYNGNEFLNFTGLGSDYNSAPVRTANAYGCIGQTNESCDLSNQGMVDTWRVGTQGITNNLYITEFSLSPGGDSPPDMDLEKVIEFINTVGPTTGALYITPLVRNVCKEYANQGEWLIYINGELYTSTGTKIDPSNCTATQKPLTPKNRDEYFVFPLNLVTKPNWREDPLAGVDPKTNFTIFNLAYDQGYQVLCPAEKTTIKKNVLGSIDEYFRQYQEIYTENSSSTLQVSAGNVKVPLYRGNEIIEQTNKLSSLEGYFGAPHILEEEVEEKRNIMLDSGVAGHLLTMQQQCQVKFNNGMVVNELCLMLEDPAQCALDKKISGSDFTPSGVFHKINQYLHGDEGEPVSCGDWVLPWNVFEKNKPIIAEKITQDVFEKTQTAIKNMPLINDLAYKMAYIVITPLQNPDDGRDPFWFLADSAKSSPSHVPIIIGIKIPDFLTNKSFTHSLEDPALLTINALKEDVTIIEKYNEEVGRREGFLNSIISAQETRSRNSQKNVEQQESQIINCTDMDQCTKSTPDIPVYLKEALIDMINGQGDACGGSDFKIEDAGDIFSYGDATIKAGARNFVGEYYNAIIPQNNSQLFEWGVRIASGGEARSNFINPVFNPLSSDNIPVMVHMIAPLGTTIDDVQTGLWYTHTLEQKEKTELEAPDYLPLKGIDFSFTDIIGKKFWNDSKDCGTAVDEYGRPVSLAPCDNDEFKIELTDREEKKGLVYPGAKVGWLVKKIQESVNTIDSITYNYVVSCKTTEDMFLGRCEGGRTDRVPVENYIAVAQCTGNARFTTGEGSNHVYTDSTQACTKFCAPNAGIICPEDPSADHDIPNWKNPNDPHVPCENLYSPVACVGNRTLIQNPVNNLGQFDENGTMTACEYVVEQAKQAGVSPRFALAMWGEESGFSHFRVPDFGVISKPRQDIGEQVKSFLEIVNAENTLLEFYERYSGETRGANTFCNNKAFVARMEKYYYWLEPGRF